jgi:hypothetical protein
MDDNTRRVILRLQSQDLAALWNSQTSSTNDSEIDTALRAYRRQLFIIDQQIHQINNAEMPLPTSTTLPAPPNASICMPVSASPLHVPFPARPNLKRFDHLVGSWNARPSRPKLPMGDLLYSRQNRVCSLGGAAFRSSPLRLLQHGKQVKKAPRRPRDNARRASKTIVPLPTFSDTTMSDSSATIIHTPIVKVEKLSASVDDHNQDRKLPLSHQSRCSTCNQDDSTSVKHISSLTREVCKRCGQRTAATYYYCGSCYSAYCWACLD